MRIKRRENNIGANFNEGKAGMADNEHQASESERILLKICTVNLLYII